MRRCTPGSKKFAKRVRGLDGKMHCVRYGDRSMTIKKHIPSRKKSFCARHRCATKTDPATPGYQSCKEWNCATGRSRHTSAKRMTRIKRNRSKRSRSRSKSAKRMRKTSKKSRRSRRKSRRSKSAKRMRRPTRVSGKAKTRKSRGTAGKKRKTRCWRGYEPVPGKRPYSKGSCRKIK